MNVRRISLGLLTALFLLNTGMARAGQMTAAAPYPPLETWKKAVLAGNSTQIAGLYGSSPQIMTAGSKNLSATDDANYWAGWKAKGLTHIASEIVQQQNPQPNAHVVVLHLALTVHEKGAAKKYFIAMAQGWVEQKGEWKIAFEQRGDPAGLRQPIEKHDIYSATADARQEIADAIRLATATHKNIVLVFGGNWCYDCHVLDDAFHSEEIAPTLNKSFEVVHVDVGEYDKNLDIAKQYAVPLERGVPALAVLDSSGKLLYSQKSGEFEKTRVLSTEDIVAFLNKWKPRA